MWGSNIVIDERKLDTPNPSNHNRRPDVPDAGYPLPTEDGEPEGAWGETDVGHFNPQQAMIINEGLRRDLLHLEKSRSRDTQLSLHRTTSAWSQKNRKAPRRGAPSVSSTSRSTQPDGPSSSSQPVEAVEEPEVLPEAEDGAAEDEAGEDDFELERFMREGRFEKRVDGEPQKRVGVIFKDLTVKGLGA